MLKIQRNKKIFITLGVVIIILIGVFIVNTLGVNISFENVKTSEEKLEEELSYRVSLRDIKEDMSIYNYYVSHMLEYESHSPDWISNSNNALKEIKNVISNLEDMEEPKKYKALTPILDEVKSMLRMNQESLSKIIRDQKNYIKIEEEKLDEKSIATYSRLIDAIEKMDKIESEN